MENSKKNADVSPETEMPLVQPSDSYAERTDVTETENWPQGLLDTAAIETETIRYDFLLQNNADGVDFMISSNEFKDELQICEDNGVLTEEKDTIVGSNETHREDETNITSTPHQHHITMLKMLTDKICEEISVKRNKKNSQSLIDDKNEDAKKIVNHGKTIRQKRTRKSKKTMPLPANLDQTHRWIDKGLRKYNVKSELHKTQTGRCLKNTISPLAVHVQSNDTNSTFHTNISRCRIPKEQILNQHCKENLAQYLYYNNVKCSSSNQEIMSANTNPWLMAPMSTRSATLSDNISNMQTENHFINNVQYSTSIDRNWNQNKNPCINDHSIDLTESYNLFNSEGQNCYNVCDLSYTGDDKYNDPKNFSNIRFQQMPTNSSLNYITSTAASNNSSNAMSRSFNAFHHYQPPLQTDDSFKKLYYTSPDIAPMAEHVNNNSSEMMSVIKENVMPPQNGDMSIWHHVHDITAYNNHLNIPLDASVPSCSNVLPSYPLYTDNNINASVYFNDQYNKHTLNQMNLLNQNAERENFVSPYVGSFFENTLPAIDMHTLNPYKDDGLTNTLSHESYTPDNVEYETRIISDITNFSSEIDIAEASDLI